MAAAKGFCYALKIPLITRNTLGVMAESMISVALEKQALICPMIDARRDEVFTAVYKFNAEPSTVIRQPSTILPPQAMILDKNSFESDFPGIPSFFLEAERKNGKKFQILRMPFLNRNLI